MKKQTFREVRRRLFYDMEEPLGSANIGNTDFIKTWADLTKYAECCAYEAQRAANIARGIARTAKAHVRQGDDEKPIDADDDDSVYSVHMAW